MSQISSTANHPSSNFAITLKIQVPDPSSAPTPSASINNMDVEPLARTTNTPSPSSDNHLDTENPPTSNLISIPSDAYTHILSRITQLEEQAIASNTQVKKFCLTLNNNAVHTKNLQAKYEELQANLEVEREEHQLFLERHRQLSIELDNHKNRLEVLESVQAERLRVDDSYLNGLEAGLMERLQLKVKEDDEAGEEEMNKRVLAIKNAGKDAISQIHKAKTDIRKEDIKVSLWFQAIEKAKKDALGVISREKQVLEEMKNQRKHEINDAINHGINSITSAGKQVRRGMEDLAKRLLIELEGTAYHLNLEQERAILKIKQGDYVICGTHTQKELIEIIDSLPKAKNRKSKNNKNKNKNNNNNQKTESVAVQEAIPVHGIRNHMLEDPDLLGRKMDLRTFLQINPGPSPYR
ncbi:hypothetical protein I302_101254 [Kwoniella bestiolae CBS 10118]|uniref:Uncharacterized protein n=1 Tax=Kwoniella bestiolae CBS 10118 TaxID=1296100 RepID=A0A1B9G7D6_9TREE|nr:hypothetical protein I302_04626 [Kwoniella bestiolae CBS 10118]OCF26935.1 hypothetical protein I302_04626 [Kwoniella bestiolae CBS 10118]